MYVFSSFSFGPVIRTASDFSLSSSAKHKKNAQFHILWKQKRKSCGWNSECSSSDLFSVVQLMTFFKKKRSNQQDGQ